MITKFILRLIISDEHLFGYTFHNWSHVYNNQPQHIFKSISKWYHRQEWNIGSCEIVVYGQS